MTTRRRHPAPVPARSVAIALVAVLVALGPSLVDAGEAVYRIRGQQLPVDAVTNGHLQTVTAEDAGGALVRVVTSWGPIGAVGPYAAVLAAGPRPVPGGFNLPPDLARRLRPEESAWDAATAVLEWVATHVRLDGGDLRPQDATSVLARRRGRCSGLANLTAALLLAAGFDARTVSGLLVDRGELVPHRWVECLLPGAGWVPTDPTLGLWVVTPSHLAFPDAVTVPPELEVVALRGGALEQLPRHRGRSLRPNEGSELVCRLVGGTPPRWPTAVLEGPAGENRRSLLQPEGRFSGLLPGAWRLTVELDGRVLDRQWVEVRPGAFNTIVLVLDREQEVGS